MSFWLDVNQEENDIEYDEEGEAVDVFDSDFDEDVSSKYSISHHWTFHFTNFSDGLVTCTRGSSLEGYENKINGWV